MEKEGVREWNLELGDNENVLIPAHVVASMMNGAQEENRRRTFQRKQRGCSPKVTEVLLIGIRFLNTAGG